MFTILDSLIKKFLKIKEMIRDYKLLTVNYELYVIKRMMIFNNSKSFNSLKV